MNIKDILRMIPYMTAVGLVLATCSVLTCLVIG